MSGSNNILIVDDDEMIRDVVTRILKLKGYSSDQASSGDKAIEMLKDNSDYAFVILDLNMPGNLSGEDTFYEIKQTFTDVKVIISTGFIDTNLASRFKSNGVHGILEKPYKVDDLIALLEK